MAYSDASKFRADFEAVQQAGLAFHGMSKTFRSLPYTDGWNVYTHSKGAALRMQIFGRHIFDANDQVVSFMKKVPNGESAQMPTFMVGITSQEIGNFGKSNANESGSMLLTGKDGWNMTINDCWLVGAVHSYQDFHPASPITDRNIFNDQWVLTITGRELVGLAMAGYTETSGHASLGKVYTTGLQSRADGLNLVDYQVKISELKTVSDARAFLNDAGFKIAV